MASITVVIFGATGDLTSRKLIPALYGLFSKGRLPADVQIVGVARSTLSDDEFRARLSEAAAKFANKKEWNRERWNSFAGRLFYTRGDAAAAGGLEGLKTWFREHEDSEGSRRLYYLAVAPELYAPIAEQLGRNKLTAEDGGWRRLVIEKPFGRDLDSARTLNRTLHEHFREDQIYRIDHYLGKETVQNILVFRFANTLFEPLWNQQYIDHVQVSVAEAVPVGQRGSYYDKAGVLRDMFQNHLLQVLSLVTMEARARFTADSLRNEKIKVLDSIPIPTEAQARQQLACAQYQGYRREPGVAANSRTPTFALARLQVDNWRWQRVPFYLCSGKALKERCSEVIIQFHCPPHLIFPVPAGKSLRCNRLKLSIQPEEGIHLSFQTKVPDHNMTLCTSELEFLYARSYPDIVIPEAYERLLQDALNGDAMLFMRSDEIERAWEIMDPIIAAAEEPGGPELDTYPQGSWGPANAAALVARDGREWVEPGGAAC